MNTGKQIIPILLVIVSLLPLGYVLVNWDQIPDSVPIHYGRDLKPNRMGTKEDLVLIVGCLAAVATASYFLIRNLHRIDPKRASSTSSSTFNKIATGLVVFIAAINFTTILAATKNSVFLEKGLIPLFGVFYAFLGNYMNNIKPNYIVGIRVPWTLSSDDNWRKTHHFAGKLWFISGLLITVVSLLTSPSVGESFLIGVTIIIALLPIIYSFILFRKDMSKTHR